MLISSLLSPKPKKNKDDLTPPTSQFGADLPRLFGKFSVGGNLYYARKPIGKKKGKGISRKASKPDENFLNCAVSICEGERHFNDLVMDTLANDPASTGQFNVLVNFVTLAFPNDPLYKISRTRLDGFPPQYGLYGVTEGVIRSFETEKAYPQAPTFEAVAISNLSNSQTPFESWFGALPSSPGANSFGVTLDLSAEVGYSISALTQYRYPVIQLVFFQNNKYYRPDLSFYGTDSVDLYNAASTNNVTVANGLNTRLLYTAIYENNLQCDTFAQNGAGTLDYLGKTRAIPKGSSELSLDFNWNRLFGVALLFTKQPFVFSAGIGDPLINNYREPVTLSFAYLNATSFGAQTTAPTSANTGKCTLSKIWMQDKIWYDANATGQIKEDSDKHKSYFTFYNGSLNQLADETLIAILGEDRVSAFQGVVTVVFKNLPGGEWNGNYPTMKFEIESDLAPTARIILNDIMCRAGYTVNKPLIQGRDYEILDDDINDIIPIDGYLLSQETGDYRNALADICQIFRLSIVSTDIISGLAFNPSARYIGYYPRPAFLVIPIDGYNVDQDVDFFYRNLGAETQEYTIPEPFINGQKDVQSYPSGIDLSFFQPRLDYQRETTRAERVSRGSGEVRSISTNASWSDRSKAGAFAIWLVKRAWRNANNYLAKVAFPIMPGARGYGLAGTGEYTVNVAQSGEWQPATLSEAVFASTYASKVVLGADGRSEVTLVSTGAGVQDLIYSENPIDLGSVGDVETDQSVVIWFEGVNLTANGAIRTINVLVAPAVAEADGLSNTVAIATSADNQNLTTTSTTTSGNSVRIKVEVIQSADINFFDTNTIDNYTVLEIKVPVGVTLSNISEASALALNNNAFYSPDLGLGSFTTASLIGAQTYRISGFVWNYKGSIAESERRLVNLMTEFWLLTAPIITLEAPAIATSGALLYVHTRDANTVQSTFGKVFRNLNLAPRPVKNTFITTNVNGDLVITWEPGTSQLITVEPDIYQPPIADSLAIDEYHLAVYDAGRAFFNRATPVRTVTGLLTPTYTYLIADQITDAIPLQDLRFEVKRLGAVSTAPFFSYPNEFGLFI